MRTVRSGFVYVSVLFGDIIIIVVIIIAAAAAARARRAAVLVCRFAVGSLGVRGGLSTRRQALFVTWRGPAAGSGAR